MRCIFSPSSLLLLAALQSSSFNLASASPLSDTNGQKVFAPEQAQDQPLKPAGTPQPTPKRKLFGRFLHITDVHPDPLYLRNSSTALSQDCHTEHGHAGYWGAEKSECDSPIVLANATFEWIRNNLRDNIDFVIWTGDNIRHDNDPRFPRNESQIFQMNRMMVEMMYEVFKKPDDEFDKNPNDDLIIPVVPTLGNNDIMPHNIMLSGPSEITHTYLDIWRNFIPEHQRHMFQHGAYFWSEVIPNKLAVFSLNTIYFFRSNAAVDGCNFMSEPGYQHFTWLKVQLDQIRARGMKAMMMGHVPPARTRNKHSWDDTCWSKFVIWCWHYRDIIVGNIFGHMNLDHFLLLDVNTAHQIQRHPRPRWQSESNNMSAWEEPVRIQVAGPYLSEVREVLSQMPQPPLKSKNQEQASNLRKKYIKKIGGKYAERYVPAFVGPSVLPNYFPSLRVFEYNITGLVDADGYLLEDSDTKKSTYGPHPDDTVTPAGKGVPLPDPNIPSPPPTDAAPGPAYSPQSLSFTGITVYYANLTYLNGWVPKHDQGDDEEEGGNPPPSSDGAGSDSAGNQKKPRQPPRPLEYKFEYSTFNDTEGLYTNMQDMSVRSLVKLANAMRDADVQSECLETEETTFCDTKDLDDDTDDDTDDSLGDDLDNDLDDGDVEGEKKKKKKARKHKNHHQPNQKTRDKLWHLFVKRAFVSAMSDDEIDQIEKV
ncbi:Endopolyphosphatase [Orbilia brochopaga]|uniref:Endopolyphosphatase n=1 Tax=Orbilia brochopaga TaxID=3140254 RepID=A0AAV9U0V7_9PEZI